MALRHPLTGVPLECVAPLPEGLASYIAAVDARKGREFSIDNVEQMLARGL